MRLAVLMIYTMLLTGCAMLRVQPMAPPPPTACAQEITRAQAVALLNTGSINAEVRGSPDDAQRVLASKANQANASYYVIQLVDETAIPGMWYARALLYRSTGSDSPVSSPNHCRDDTPH